MTVPPFPPAPILTVASEATAIARELLDVLQRESAALAAMRLQAPTGFAEIKNRLVVAYRYKLEELQEAAQVPEAKAALDELKAINVEVMAAARHNAAVLEGALDGNRRLIDLLIKAAERRRGPTTVGYGRVGNRAAPPRPGAATSVMITRRL